MIRPRVLRIAILFVPVFFLPVLALIGWKSLLKAQAKALSMDSLGLGFSGTILSVDLKGSISPREAVTTTISPAKDASLTIIPGVYEGDLRDAPVVPEPSFFLPAPLRLAPGEQRKAYVPQLEGWRDPVVQVYVAPAQMPLPDRTFAGMGLSTGGAGWPPDPNGDVGPDHYIQTVNTSLAIYDKETGQELWRRSFNQFFQLSNDPAIQATPCYNQNYGDPIVLYDPYVERWLVTDFAFAGLNTPPFYECLAVSRTSDPITGGWYFYALRADTGNFFGYLNDYPKLGIWWDGWYMSANMFQEVPPYTGFGVRLWALDRNSMIQGLPLQEIHFDLCSGGTCESLLPANLRGSLPPINSPQYFLGVGNQALQLWKMFIDWEIPSNSTLIGPINIPVEPFAISASVPQPNSPYALDSLGPRLMFPLQYQFLNGQESIWANHTVSNQGVAGIRWYEISNLSGVPSIVQQGTFQPDNLSRWMGSMAVDREGNMAIGYSTSNAVTYPGIRYTGRLGGELPGTLTQGENILIQGQGSQTNTYRWGDYTSMSIDPEDGCTFWYTNKYYVATGNNWQTRIGTFRFPSCGRSKGTLTGVVYNRVTNQVIPEIAVSANSPTVTLTSETNEMGVYTITLPSGQYQVVAGPKLPGFPVSQTMSGVAVYNDEKTALNFYLDPVPYLAGHITQLEGMIDWANGYAIPGEDHLSVWRAVRNSGAVTATQVTGELTSFTAGVHIHSRQVLYPSIPVDAVINASNPYVVSIDTEVPCGSNLKFQQVLSSEKMYFTDTFTITTGVPITRRDIFSMDVEGSTVGWSGDEPWGITSLNFYSPSYSWADSPIGFYKNNSDASLKTPVLDLSGMRKTRLSGWILYDLELGWDYLYIEYSLDGGSSWSQYPLLTFTGKNLLWKNFAIDTPFLDLQSNVQFRFRLVSDASITYDGVYLDDLTLNYEPRVCFQYLLPALRK